MILINFKIKVIMTVPIPINFSEAEIGAALVNIKEMKQKTRAVPINIQEQKTKIWAS
jgi:hypothetical protein